MARTKKSPMKKSTTKVQNAKRPAQSRSSRAGVVFPVARIHRYLRKNQSRNHRFNTSSAVFIAAVIEYLCAELLESTATEAIEKNKVRIIPRHLILALDKDEEMKELFKGVIIPEAGVVSRYQNVTLPIITQKIQKKVPNKKEKELKTAKESNENHRANETTQFRIFTHTKQDERRTELDEKD